MTALSTFGGIVTMVAVAYLAVEALDEARRRYHPGETDGPIAFGALFNFGYWATFATLVFVGVMVYGSLPAAGKVTATVASVGAAVAWAVRA
jgi:hypothetical protein